MRRIKFRGCRKGGKNKGRRIAVGLEGEDLPGKKGVGGKTKSDAISRFWDLKAPERLFGNSLSYN